MVEKKTILLGSMTTFVVMMIACEKMLTPPLKEEEVLAGTIPGLTKQQEQYHLVGDEAFGNIFTPETGLGPVFVQTSCSKCHVGNGKGHPTTVVTRFGKMTNNVIDYLYDKGGTQLQERSIAGYPAEEIPSEANAITKRMPPAVMGLGYIAALSDASIIANADSNDVNGDGISGRPNYIGQSIGRFGKKAEKITLQDQVVFALKQDIGITSDFDIEDIYNPQAGKNTGDNVTDPEVSASFVHSLVFYMRTLKAPTRINPDNPDVLEGEKLFNQINCTSCHKATFTTAQSDIEALSNQTFHPYSDFLLHDMGEALDDGYPEGSAKSSEWRTPPLWGLGLAKDSQGGRLFLLHDGRAKTFEEAVSFHGGEATGNRTAFFALSEQEQKKIIKFLESL